ncbi:MAG TPA: hypothetical protein VIJ21_05495 [Solirubrobacterales bacterium]
MARLFAGGSDDRSPRRRWTDRIIGITIGVVLGLGVLVYFVFVHSEGTIDAPKINSSESSQAPGESLPAHPGSPKQTATGEPKQTTNPQKQRRPVPIVKVVGGAPPTGSGPEQLNFKQNEQIRFEIETDEPFSFEIRGLGVKQSIESSSIISFKAHKSGQFPVISTSTLIGVADLLIAAPHHHHG